jgi:hypothetical protein
MMCNFIDLNDPDAWTNRCYLCGTKLCTSMWSVGKTSLACSDCEDEDCVWSS